MNDAVCEWLRRPAPSGLPSADVLAAARTEGVHLVLADRFAVPGLAEELRRAAVLDEIGARELRAVLAALAHAGVRPVLLKGAALAYTHYPRPELRVRSDTDLLISDHARTRTADALTALGYFRADEVDGDVAVAQFHFIKTDRHGVHHQLDVHWRVSNARVFADVLSYAEADHDGVPLPALGPHARAASNVHALLIACVHRIAHHDDAENLLWLLDVHLLAGAMTADERERFIQLARARQMHAVCARTIALSQAAFGKLDAAWAAGLSADAPQDEPSRAFIGGGMRQADILLSDLAATPAWADRVRLMKEHLLPAASYMRARYPRWPAVLLPAAYAYRVLCGLPRWFRRTSCRASGAPTSR